MLTRVALLIAVLTSVLGVSPASAEKRVALVIGNDDYRNVPTLQNAANDARTMGGALEKLGFTVLLASDLTQRGMSEKLLAFDRMIEKGDTAFFFFAGHGYEINQRNYLLPTDVPSAGAGQEELVRDASFPVERIIDRMQARGARVSILVLDACRNDPFTRDGTRGSANTGGLAAFNPPAGVFVVYSAGAKQLALDRLSDNDPDKNSVFMRQFVRELSVPGLNLSQIAKRTQTSVWEMAARARHNQFPAYYDQVLGDIVLNNAPGGEPSPGPAPERQIAVLPKDDLLPQRREPAKEPVISNEPINAPIADFTRHNGGWSVTLSFADPVAAISWRLGEQGSFKETGFLDTIDPRTRKRMANPSIQLDADVPAGTLYIRTVDARGEPAGPYPIRFEPQAAVERGQRKILEMTSGSWLAFGGYNAPLLYYTHLISYRCAIREVRIGIDSSVPDKVITLPPCDLKNPSAIPSNVQPYLKVGAATKAVSVELTYRDGTVSEVKTFRK